VVLRIAPCRGESLVAAPAEHQSRGLGQLFTLERERLGQELDVLDHPATAAVLLTWPTAGAVHDAVERHEAGVDEVAHTAVLLPV
jgi:hypothetical protein